MVWRVGGTVSVNAKLRTTWDKKRLGTAVIEDQGYIFCATKLMELSVYLLQTHHHHTRTSSKDDLKIRGRNVKEE